MSGVKDGPSSPLFAPVRFTGNTALSALASPGISEAMAAALEHAPSGPCVAWGIPFEIGHIVAVSEGGAPASVALSPTRARWLVFMHTSDVRPPVFSPASGEGRLAEHAADYIVLYEGGGEERLRIRRRQQIGAFRKRWGENCFEAVAHHKPWPQRAGHEQPGPEWGWSQTRVATLTGGPAPWLNWLWAWENPHPEKAIVGVRFEPVSGAVIVSAIAAGDAACLPLRWQARRKAVLRLPEGERLWPDLDEHGLLRQIQLDLGQVISAAPRAEYPNPGWEESYHNQPPAALEREVLVEYTAHEDACFHLNWDTAGQLVVPVAHVAEGRQAAQTFLRPVPPAGRRVTLRVVEADSGRAVPAKLHVHGEAGEYLAPVDRHRLPNPAWFEDYSVDFVHRGAHACTYIPGETLIDLPLGRVYVEVSKGFEIRPVRRVFEVRPDTQEILVEIEKVLPWRERGWVTADTHVHFLSPISALLEGAAEGVNVVNLLASQWGELMTNVGDFDGRTTWGARETGGDGEYLVRVGTENRQHVLGHISLLGYRGAIIAPMTTGGPDESALGDPVATLLSEWARQCKAQGGLVVLPHFPNPRAEHAAAIVVGDVDAIEMTSWENLYRGIDPYSLADWYRYLNCGYRLAAVGGTDKMSADTALGTVRTYARIPSDTPFSYDTWMDAVRRAETFVTYGPLLEFAVDGQPMGGRISMPAGGGTVDVAWEVASVTVPISRVELVANGEIRESLAVPPGGGAGHWPVRVDKSAWLALLARGHYPDRPEIVAAHSSPVMVSVQGSPLLAAADALTILEQIEGALAYLDTLGTRADEAAYKRMRLVLTSAHRSLHNRMHQSGYYHEHTSLVTDHSEHHKT